MGLEPQEKAEGLRQGLASCVLAPWQGQKASEKGWSAVPEPAA